MTLEAALRATEILLALAFVQQSAEHLTVCVQDRLLFGARILLSILLLLNLFTTPALVGLAVTSLVMLHRFQGPYNGGSCRMSVLILWCVMGAHLAPTLLWQEALLSYLAFQLILSYFMSGKVKLMNREWRSGQALRDVFAFSAYPVSQGLRRFSERSTLLWTASWLVILFEVLFPFALVHPLTLSCALVLAAGFHLANAFLFGLNRFVWIWLAAYPSLLWFQGRVFEAA